MDEGDDDIMVKGIPADAGVADGHGSKLKRLMLPRGAPLLGTAMPRPIIVGIAPLDGDGWKASWNREALASFKALLSKTACGDDSGILALLATGWCPSEEELHLLITAPSRLPSRVYKGIQDSITLQDRYYTGPHVFALLNKFGLATQQCFSPPNFIAFLVTRLVFTDLRSEALGPMLDLARNMVAFGEANPAALRQFLTNNPIPYLGWEILRVPALFHAFSAIRQSATDTMLRRLKFLQDCGVDVVHEVYRQDAHLPLCADGSFSAAEVLKMNLLGVPESSLVYPSTASDDTKKAMRLQLVDGIRTSVYRRRMHALWRWQHANSVLQDAS